MNKSESDGDVDLIKDSTIVKNIRDKVKGLIYMIPMYCLDSFGNKYDLSTNVTDHTLVHRS